MLELSDNWCKTWLCSLFTVVTLNSNQVFPSWFFFLWAHYVLHCSGNRKKLKFYWVIYARLNCAGVSNSCCKAWQDSHIALLAQNGPRLIRKKFWSTRFLQIIQLFKFCKCFFGTVETGNVFAILLESFQVNSNSAKCNCCKAWTHNQLGFKFLKTGKLKQSTKEYTTT